MAVMRARRPAVPVWLVWSASVAVLAAGCGGSGVSPVPPTSLMSAPPPRSSTSPGFTATTAPNSTSASSGGLDVTVTASPSHGAAGTLVDLTVRARETHAPGALTYQISYGDGSTDQNTAPAMCRGGTAPPASQSWQRTHRYGQVGTYTVAATVQANCTPDRATATVMVTIA